MFLKKTLVRDSLVSLLIIVELFLCFGRPVILFLHWGIFHVKQIMSHVFFLNFYFVFYFYWCSSYVLASFWGIYFRCLLLYYRFCYYVDFFSPSSSTTTITVVVATASHLAATMGMTVMAEEVVVTITTVIPTEVMS